MKKREIEEILKAGEGARLEFKKAVSPSIGRELSAFANTAGGQIFIGIDDKNKVQGCKLSNQIKSRIQDIANNCDPRVFIKIDPFNYDDKELIVVTVPESVDKPIQCAEGFFLREGANSQKMTRNEIFYWAQKTRKIRYEDQFRDDFKYPEDFNENAFAQLMEKMNLTITGEPEDLLHNLGLGENRKHFKINNAGIMLFGKKRDLYIRQVYLTCVLYKGTDKIKILDRKDFRDGLVDDYDNAFKFLQQHLRLEYVIEGSGPRKEVPEIPYEALKEALLNAIIHRDYFEIGARVMVEIFDDRVEISNPGELLFEKEKIGKKSVSIARNPILFDIFNRLQMVEKVGTGIKRIFAVLHARNLRVEFDIDSFFKVTFYRPVLMQVHEDDAGQVRDKYRTSTGQVPDKFKEIIEFCLSPKSLKEIMTRLKLKHRESFINSYLKPLLSDELITLTIPSKPRSSRQKYVTTEKGQGCLK
jgi:ATP-dependent DNA helicase RecG